MKDYVAGYAGIRDITLDENAGLGTITLRATELNGKEYHPFAAAAWQHLKMNYPQGAMDGVDLDNADNIDLGEAIDRFGAALGQAKAIFTNFIYSCLITQIKAKFCFLKQITIHD